MKFGVREICDVVLKAKANQKIGNKIFYKNEPVIYFDTLKTSSMEGAATTVYAQGGRGNSRLVAWEGERTVTFTMEDALISPAGFMILSGAGLIEAGSEDSKGNKQTIKVHTTEQTDSISVNGNVVTITLENTPYIPASTTEDWVYVMLLDDGEVVTEPYIAEKGTGANEITFTVDTTMSAHDNYKEAEKFKGAIVLVDYYIEKDAGAQEITITPDKFGGNYYLEASTLFRSTDGVDMPAEFVIPNCKIQSNFTFTMASSGDPSTFTFTMDAFPDYTRFDKTKKVLAAIQIIAETSTESSLGRSTTPSNHTEDSNGIIIQNTTTGGTTTGGTTTG